VVEKERQARGDGLLADVPALSGAHVVHKGTNSFEPVAEVFEASCLHHNSDACIRVGATCLALTAESAQRNKRGIADRLEDADG
jgi:hypothetical protein